MGIVLHSLQFHGNFRPGSKNTKADALSRKHGSSLLPRTNEPIISPMFILAPVKWDIMTEITDGHASDPPDAPQIAPMCHPHFASGHSIGPLISQFQPSRYRCHYSSPFQMFLVAHSTIRYHHLHS